MPFENCCYLPGLLLDYGGALAKNTRYYEPGVRCCLNCLAERYRQQGSGGDGLFAMECEGGDPRWNKDTI